MRRNHPGNEEEHFVSDLLRLPLFQPTDSAPEGLTLQEEESVDWDARKFMQQYLERLPAFGRIAHPRLALLCGMWEGKAYQRLPGSGFRWLPFLGKRSPTLEYAVSARFAPMGRAGVEGTVKLEIDLAAIGLWGVVDMEGLLKIMAFDGTHLTVLFFHKKGKKIGEIDLYLDANGTALEGSWTARARAGGMAVSGSLILSKVPEDALVLSHSAVAPSLADHRENPLPAAFAVETFHGSQGDSIQGVWQGTLYQPMHGEEKDIPGMGILKFPKEGNFEGEVTARFEVVEGAIRGTCRLIADFSNMGASFTHTLKGSLMGLYASATEIHLDFLNTSEPDRLQMGSVDLTLDEDGISLNGTWKADALFSRQPAVGTLNLRKISDDPHTGL